MLKKSDFFNHIVVGNGPNIYLYDEIMYHFDRRLYQVKSQGKSEEEQNLKIEGQRYLDAVKAEIVNDPIGFGNNLTMESYRLPDM